MPEKLYLCNCLLENVFVFKRVAYMFQCRGLARRSLFVPEAFVEKQAEAGVDNVRIIEYPLLLGNLFQGLVKSKGRAVGPM